MKSVVHIGSKIKQVLRESRIPVKEFAIKMNKTRMAIYELFKRETVDTGMLETISEILQHDFFLYYTQAVPIEEKHRSPYRTYASVVEELEECKKALTELKEKYELMKKVNEMMEEKLLRKEVEV